MSEPTKHTPGPWEATCPRGKNWFIRQSETGEYIFESNQYGSMREADARLIAAAPDLLDALKEYLAWGAMTASDRYLFDAKFRAAIAKAEGRDDA